MKDSATPLEFRGPRPDDIGFIYSTFLKGLWHGNKQNTLLKDLRPSKSEFFDTYHRKLTEILSNPFNTILVACLSEAPEIILGYSVFSGNTLHCMYVKKAYRGCGIGRLLLPESVKTVSFATDPFRELFSKLNIEVKEPK
jgi:GNAT superfamily N-acetyltransferase